jgi:hypothetical protein
MDFSATSRKINRLLDITIYFRKILENEVTYYVSFFFLVRNIDFKDSTVLLVLYN